MAQPAGDTYFNQTVLLMHMDTTALHDVKGKVITLAGNAARSATQSKFGGYSAYFDGTGDYLTTPDSADFAFGSGDFTIECWFKQGATGGTYALCAQRTTTTSSYSFSFQITGSTLTFICSTSGTATTHTATVAYTQETASWHHAAAVRSGTNLIVFVDGTAGTSVGISTTALSDSAAVLSIGGDTTGSSNQFNGYIDELRITKGFARYTTGFTPHTAAHPDSYLQVSGTTRNSSGTLTPHVVRVMRCADNSEAGDVISNPSTGEYAVAALDSSPHYAVFHSDLFDTNWLSTSLLLHMNDTGLTDETGRSITLNGGAARSATQSKFGGYSAYFDGTGDYLSVTGESLGTGDFTVEGWIRPSAAASTNLMFDTRTSDNDSTGFAFYLRSTGKLAFIYGNGVVVEGVTTYSANTWYHIAAVRISGVIKLYLNGITEASFSQGNTYSNTGWKIGHQWSVLGTLGAFYLDELRVTKAGRYTAPFTPYEAEFPHGYTGTENALIYDNITPY